MTILTGKSCVFALLIGLFLLSFFFDGEKDSAVIFEDRSTPLYSGSLDVHFFYGEGCPHCADVKPFLDDMEQKYPLHIHRYDIYTNRSSISLFDEVCNRYGIEHRGVPTVFVSDACLVGDSPIIEGFEGVVKNALENPMIRTIKIESAEASGREVVSVSNVPSLLTITVAGLVDSISPCSLAILVFLIGARVLVNRKKRILRVGLAFCLSVFIAYFLFGLGLFTVVQLSGFSNIFGLLVGLVALLVGLFYLKDVFWYHRGGFSMEVPGRLKPVLTKMLKGVTSPIGAFLMGFIAVCFELPCTGGPYLFILGQLADSTTRLQAIPLLLYYNFLFVLPLIIVSLLLYSNLFSIGNIREWNEKNKRLMKLIGGLIMVALGLLTLPTLPVLHSIQTFLSIYKMASLPLLSSIFLYFIFSHKRSDRIEKRLKGTLLTSTLSAIVFIAPSPANLPEGRLQPLAISSFHATVLYSDDCPRSGALVKVLDPADLENPVGMCALTNETGHCETTFDPPLIGSKLYYAYAYWPDFGTEFGWVLSQADPDGDLEVTIEKTSNYPNGEEACGDSECDGFRYCIIPEEGSPYIECDSWDTECDTKKCCQCDEGTIANPTENYDETQDEDCEPGYECSGLDTCSLTSSNFLAHVIFADDCPVEGAIIKVFDPPDYPEYPAGMCAFTNASGYCEASFKPSLIGNKWYAAYAYWPDVVTEFSSSLFLTDANGDGTTTIQDAHQIMDDDGNGVGDCHQPQWRNQGQNRSSIGKLQSNYLYAEAKSYELDWAWLSTNEKGYWENTTYTDMNDATSWTWSNFTWQNSSFTGTLSWKIYYNDTSGFTNVTDTMSFKVYDKPPCTNPITECCVIDQGGTYYVANDIQASGDCIVIQTDANLVCSSHTIAGDGTGVGVNVTNSPEGAWPIIRECNIENFEAGILVDDTGHSEIGYNVIKYNFWGVLLFSNNNFVYSNQITDNTVGAQPDTGWYNEIINNYFRNEYNGHTPNDEPNYWNTTKIALTNIIGGPYIGGNYWSDYDGEDADGDGIGDTPYTIFGGTNKDYLPLIPPHGIAITNMTTSKTIVGTEYPVTINITSKNLGLYTETFSITAYANTTIIDSEEIALASKASTFTIFTWDTTGFEKGNYTISAYATPVPEENETADNTYTDGTVLVTIKGDVNGDGVVDILDLSMTAICYGYFWWEPEYDPEADINGDGVVCMRDMTVIALHWGQTDP